MYSGAIEHAVNELVYFEKLIKIEDVNLTVADGSIALATHKGEVFVMVTDQPILLKNVYYVPSLPLSMVLCARLHEHVISTAIAKKQCSLY